MLASMSAAMQAGRRGDERPPLPPGEHQRLRVTGLIAGALVGVGAAVLIPGLLFAGIVILFASAGFGSSSGAELLEPWVLLPVVGGVALLVAGWLVSVRRLRHWRNRARRVTAAAAALTAVGAILVDVAMLGVSILFETAGIAPTERLLVPVAGVIGIGAGALTGRFAWPRVAERMQPAAAFATS